MPKVAINYLNTVIYKIVCNDLNIIDCYVGSTTNFTNRKRHHKDNSTYEIKNKSHRKIYQMIKNNGGWENWNMLQIEEYPCNSSQEARLRERHWYEILNSTLNAYYPCRTKQQYLQDNKDKLEAYYNFINDCTCGKTYTTRHKVRHMKTQVHLNYVNSQLKKHLKEKLKNNNLI